jgi:hypothetical protein
MKTGSKTGFLEVGAPKTSEYRLFEGRKIETDLTL